MATSAAGASSVDVACHVIRDSILSGEFPAGTWIRELVVARKAAVSRTSVRQALSLLTAEGFVELHPNRGALVVDWTGDNLRQVFDLRALLEGYCSALAATQRDEAELSLMREEADRFSEMAARKRLPPMQAIAESNNRLHRLILDAGKNRRVASLLVAVVQVPLVNQTFARYSREDLVRSAGQHQELVRAIEAQDAQWAESAMRAHIHAAKRAIFGSASGERDR